MLVISNHSPDCSPELCSTPSHYHYFIIIAFFTFKHNDLEMARLKSRLLKTRTKPNFSFEGMLMDLSPPTLAILNDSAISVGCWMLSVVLN